MLLFDYFLCIIIMQGIIILILNLTKLLTKRLLMVSSGRPLFAIDIHPDGSRFVIGGQGEYEFFLSLAVINTLLYLSM